jgi:DNA-binding GntR family transcriptional regulator
MATTGAKRDLTTSARTPTTPSEFPELARHNLYKAAYDQIWQAIVQNGAMRPGERLSDSQISARLGISRGPVREALQKLTAEGLVTATAGHGFRVRVFTDEDVDEIYSLRAALEALAAELAASRLVAADIEELQRLVGWMGARSKAGDWKGVLEADMMFHEKIVKAAGHGRLYVLWLQLRSQIIFIANYTARQLYRDIKDIKTRHQPIVDALRAKKPRSAAEASRIHVVEVHAMLREHRNANTAKK